MGQQYYRLDLHTHSILSKDGGVREDEYKHALESEKLDYIAITDHDDIAFACSLQKKLGEKIIIGEEIRTAQGEVIGLFLTERISPKLSLSETIARIKEQQGLVYLPHPFCHNRFGVSEKVVQPDLKNVDIVESFNPRNSIHADNMRAEKFAKRHSLPMAASSDSHCGKELGRVYTLIEKPLTRGNFRSLLQDPQLYASYTPFFHLFCPKKNTLKKIIRFG